MSKPKKDASKDTSDDSIAAGTGMPFRRAPDDGALSLVSCGITFFQFFQHRQEQKIPDNAQAIPAWRWSIRAPSC
jgi:hypothetical protein